MEIMRQSAATLLLISLTALTGCDNESRVPLDQTGGGVLPAGKYVGSVMMPTTVLQSTWRYNPVTRSGEVVPQAMPTLLPSPFAGGDLNLNGSGRYVMSSWKQADNSGFYSFDAAAGVIRFQTGPFASRSGTVASDEACARIKLNVPTSCADKDVLEVTFTRAPSSQPSGE
jgi:hypothetical protein